MAAAVTKTTGRVQTTIYMDADAWARIRRIALDRGCSAADIVNAAVAAWLIREAAAAQGGAGGAEGGRPDFAGGA